MPVKDKGDILVLKKELEPGVMIGDTLTTVRNSKAIVCIVNTNVSEVNLTHVQLEYERPPTQHTCNTTCQNKSQNKEQRHELLDKNLRIDHIIEGKESLRSLCNQYRDIFHLPGDKPTETKGATHVIPTPNITPELPIHLKNYRLPWVRHE